MKAPRPMSTVTAIAAPSSAILGGKVNKSTSSKGAQLLRCLQGLVPQDTKQPLSKIEIVQAVIDYIQDLQDVVSTTSDMVHVGYQPTFEDNFVEEDLDSEFEDDSDSNSESDMDLVDCIVERISLLSAVADTT
ncbi:unnamed protein product [Meganyctiphanes norvegica]|uniref:BHLH domain-containing protein n=1 Tax=Meganyctiphanes norvegica TaxID=48144 RepID=A0AAV2PYJ2_MEGNR